jgi:hypothetical protein
MSKTNLTIADVVRLANASNRAVEELSDIVRRITQIRDDLAYKTARRLSDGLDATTCDDERGVEMMLNHVGGTLIADRADALNQATDLLADRAKKLATA